MYIIELYDVKKIYKSEKKEWIGLNDVTLKVEKGEFLSIVGPSGSGKTTLLNIIGLMDSPTSGHVVIDGKDVTYTTEKEKAILRNKYIGFVFQSYNLISFMTVYQNVELPLVISGVSEKERKERVMEVLKMVPGLLELKDKKPHQLSGGQQQRVAIARALITDSPIILADEPTANLDTNTGQQVVELFRDIKERLGKTVIMATHDFEMLKYSNRIIYIRDGKIEKEEVK